MLSDPGQRLDVADNNPEVVSALELEFDNWLKDVHPLPPTEPVIPIPSQKSLKGRSIILPAHEAILMSSSGRGIRHAGSAGYANSWITDWSDTEAAISWSVDATAAQQWKATLLVACEPQDAGCRLRISSGNSMRDFVVPESHQTDFKRSRERVPPSPPYAGRNWRELSVGTLSLSHGRQEIRIIGVNRPGLCFAEIKSLKLEPLKNTSQR